MRGMRGRGGEGEREGGHKKLIKRAQKRAIAETKAIFGPLRERIAAAVERVEGMLVSFLFPRFRAFVFLFLFFLGPWRLFCDGCGG